MKFCLVAIVAAFILYSCNDDPKKENNVTATHNPIDDSILLYQQKLKTYPDSSALRLQFVSLLDSSGKYAEALQQTDTLLLKDSLNSNYWFMKAQLAQNAKDTALALQSYARAVKIYPSAGAMLSAANLYAEQKNKLALVICDQIRKQDPDREYEAHAAFISGIYYARTGDREKALQSFNACIAANYTYMEAYIEKGLLFFDNKEYDKALAVFTFAASINNLYADACYYQARCYEMMNKKDSAVMKFKQSLALDKNLVEARDGLKRLGE